MVWNWPHIHLMLNHGPVFGTVFGLLLLGGGYAFRSNDIKKAALVTFAAVGILSVISYLTGEEAEDALEGAPFVSVHFIEHHHLVATFAMGTSVLLGLFTVYVLFISAGSDMPKGLGMAVLAGGLIVCALMAWTADYGGLIHHQELRPPDQARQLQEESVPPIKPDVRLYIPDDGKR